MLTSKRPLSRREASPKRSTQGTPPAAAPSSVGSLGTLGASDVSNRERPACSRSPRPGCPWSPNALTAIVADPARAAAVSNATAVRFDTYIQNLRPSTWSAAGRTAPGLSPPRTPARGEPSPLGPDARHRRSRESCSSNRLPAPPNLAVDSSEERVETIDSPPSSATGQSRPSDAPEKLPMQPALLHASGRPRELGDEHVLRPGLWDDRIRHHVRTELTCAWATKRNLATTRR